MFYFTRAAMAAALAAGNLGVNAQHTEVVDMRTYADMLNTRHAEQMAGTNYAVRHLAANAARSPADVWRDFDATIRTVMLGDDGGMGLLRDLEPLARNVNIGKLVSEYRRASADDLEVRSSIDGNHAKPTNQSTYDYDGVVIPVHSTQVGVQWREYAGMLSEGYDELRDNRENAIRNVRKRTIDNFINGTAGLVFKGYSAYGLKNNPNTVALSLGAGGLNIDLTAPTTTLEDFRKVLIAVMQSLVNAGGNVTIYWSPEIWFNAMRIANPQTSSTESIYDVVSRLPGIAAIKKSEAFKGNEFAGIILSQEFIRPIIGMPVTATPIPRITPMDNYNDLVWGASGLQIKADTNGNAGVLYASGA